MFFCESRQEASFYIKEQKFEIRVLKLLFWTPEKARFLFLKKKNPKKSFIVFRLWFSFKNNWRTNVLLVGIFEKKLLAVKNNICASIVFKAKTEKKFTKLVDPQKSACMSFETKTVKKIFLHIFL